MKIAFYRGRTRFFNRLVSWWLRGPYSHCEVVLDLQHDGYSLCASSSFLDGGVRWKFIDLHPDRWDIFEIECDERSVEAWFDLHNGHGYDVLGIAGFVWRRTPESQTRWFCSEAIAASLGFQDPWRFDPCTLAASVRQCVSQKD